MKDQSILTSFENCPLCFSPVKNFIQSGTYHLDQCSQCRFIFLDKKQREFVTQTDIFKEQEQFEFWSVPKFYSKHKDLFSYYFEKRYQLLKKYSLSPLKILDVGCGHAFWGEFLKNKNESISYQGIDPAQTVIDEVHAKGLNVSCFTFEDYSSNELFNCLTLCDVLEHATDPRSMIQKCHRSLSDQGLLYIQVPSVFGFKIPYGHNPGLPFHYWHFSLKNLTKLLKEEGFEILDAQTGILGVIGKREKQGRIYLWQNVLWKLSCLFKRGNRLQVLARKKELRLCD